MTPEQATTAVTLLGAEYGTRQGDIDEWILIAWHQRLKDVDIPTWARFKISWANHVARQETQWPPAPIDFGRWHDAEVLAEARRNRTPLEPVFESQRATPLGDAIQKISAIRMHHFGGEVDANA